MRRDIPRWVKATALVLIILGNLGLLLYVVSTVTSDNVNSDESELLTSNSGSVVSVGSVGELPATSTQVEVAAPGATTSTPSTDVAGASTSTVSSTTDSTTDSTNAESPTSVPLGVPATTIPFNFPTTTTAAVTTAVEFPSTSAIPRTTVPQGPQTSTTGNSATLPPPPTLPDGSPEPVVAIFDTDVITLTGVVPSQDAVDRLTLLAAANSQTPATVNSLLTIDPRVPIGVGVRVIELNSVRFPEGTDDILPAHAAELDRVVAVMMSLPKVSTLVVGHSDQRGTPEENLLISEARARAVVSYFVSQGIEASRLSSRAVGGTDLLTTGFDPNSLALNRRTEFIIYGLLLP